jgi:hypothetical protein
MLFAHCRGTSEAYISRTGRSKFLTRDNFTLSFHFPKLGSTIVIDEMLLCKNILKVFLDFIQMNVLVFL